MVLCLAVLILVLPAVALSQPLSQIVEAAKAEKELVTYATTQAPVMNRLVQMFNKKYPFIKVDYYRAGAEKIAQRFETEASAGRYSADVVNLSGSEMHWTAKKGHFVAYESPERKSIRASYKDKQGLWTAQYSTIAVIGYNRRQVAAADVPKSYDDMLNAKWKGQIGLDQTDDDWYMVLVHVMGEKKAAEFIRNLAKQNVQFRRGRQLAAELLAAGEWALAPTMRIAAGEEIRR
jgi:iron(III) transport system substrate-binding protein